MPNKAQQVAIDRILVDRFKNGDPDAFTEIVARYWDKIYSRVLHLLKNKQDAEEVTQDAFVRAHRGLENFRGDSTFSTWLFQIATNLAHNKYWYWFRRKRSESISLEQSFSEDGDFSLIDICPVEEQTPCEATLNQELVDKVAENMKSLTDKHYEVLVMRAGKNMSYENIAEVLGLSIGTVKSRIARARMSLRKKMGKDFQ